MFDIVVGSGNPVKKNAAFKGFNAVWPGEVCAVLVVKFDSLVSIQPMTDTETILGAQYRAKNALELCPSARFGVGLEGGVQQIGDQWFETGWAVIRNRSTGVYGIASSIRMLLPSKAMDLITSGQCVELGGAIDKLFALQDIKRTGGTFGAMTNYVLTRTNAYRDAVVAALSRFVHPELFDMRSESSL